MVSKHCDIVFLKLNMSLLFSFILSKPDEINFKKQHKNLFVSFLYSGILLCWYLETIRNIYLHGNEGYINNVKCKQPLTLQAFIHIYILLKQVKQSTLSLKIKKIHFHR